MTPMCTTSEIDLAFRLYESAVMHTTSQGRDNCGCSPGANLLGLHVSAQPIWIGLLALAPLQVTTTVPVPGRVDGPMFQVHETMPCASAALASNPCAVEGVPAGVRELIEHEAPGVVWTATLARP